MTIFPVARPSAVEEGGPILVIDIGGTHIKFGYVRDGRPLAYRKHVPTDALRSGDAIDALSRIVTEVAAEAGLKPASVVAAVPGFIDTDHDRVLHAENVAGLNGRRLGKELGSRLGCRVLLERDAVLALMGETRAGAAQHADHVLGIFFGTGIGAAFMDGGKPFRGAGWALEIGLMPFVADGALEAGSQPDCLETHASGRALKQIAGRFDVPIERVFSVPEADPALHEALVHFVRHQALAVGMAAAMISPATILIGGGVVEMAGYPRAMLHALIASYVPAARTGRPLDLRWCQYGWDAVLYGASSIVSENQKQTIER
ncbi:ROK family protein [Paraburkholderia susongensis]|uniref:Allose kinase n=1 Tax=Paraburkholderia susongensis TaxID=1515439 RepID=A0A1X7M430_9BURK|nr:ROK family protein [Paraburkholderia susongensis]SMG60514.1 allose kinase [Paraburkholderia susongensis]